jgi:hypothetical protein
MSETRVVLEIDHPHFIIRVYENLLRIDVKGNVTKEIEEALENTPILKETVGSILGLFVPLHIRLSDIESVHMEKTGEVKIIVPHRRHVTIPLEIEEAKKLVSKLNQLIPEAKGKELERIMQENKLQKIIKEKKEEEKEMGVASALGGGALVGTMYETEKEIEKRIEEEETD